MENPYQAWEQAQERHTTQVRGVVWTLREASRIATVPGEDQNGFSKRAVEEGRRAFFQAVDSIKFGKDVSAAQKPNIVLAAVKLEDDEDIEMQIWPVGIRRDATAARLGNTVLDIGGEQVQNNGCHINNSDSNRSVSKTTHYTTKPDSTISNGGTTVISSGISSNIAQMRSRDLSAMQKLPELADLVSSHEPQNSSSSSGLSIEGGFCVTSPRTRAAQVATFKASATDAPTDGPGLLQTIEAMEKRLAAHKATAQAGGFRDHGHFADVWNADAGDVFAELSSPIMLRRVSEKAALSSKRKRSGGEAAGKGQKRRGAMRTETVATASGRDLSTGGVSMELQSTSSDWAAEIKRSPKLDPGEFSDDDLNEACLDFRRDMWNCSTRDEIFDWLGTFKSQSMDYYKAAISNAHEIRQMLSTIAPSEPLPEPNVIRDALGEVRDVGCEVRDTRSWMEWQDSFTADPSSTTFCTTDILAPDVVAPDVLAPDVLAPDVLAPDVLAPDVLAPDVYLTEVCTTEACTTEPEVCLYY